MPTRASVAPSRERRDERRFIAGETGTAYVEAIDEFDPRTQNLPDLIAEYLGGMGRMTQAVAEQDSEIALAKLAAKATIDAKADPREYNFQRLARSRHLFNRAAATDPVAGPLLGLAVILAETGAVSKKDANRP